MFRNGITEGTNLETGADSALRLVRRASLDRSHGARRRSLTRRRSRTRDLGCGTRRRRCLARRRRRSCHLWCRPRRRGPAHFSLGRGRRDWLGRSYRGLVRRRRRQAWLLKRLRLPKRFRPAKRILSKRLCRGSLNRTASLGLSVHGCPTVRRRRRRRRCSLSGLCIGVDRSRTLSRCAGRRGRRALHAWYWKRVGFRKRRGRQGRRLWFDWRRAGLDRGAQRHRKFPLLDERGPLRRKGRQRRRSGSRATHPRRALGGYWLRRLIDDGVDDGRVVNVVEDNVVRRRRAHRPAAAT